MISVKIRFNYNGKEHKLSAILTNDCDIVFNAFNQAVEAQPDFCIDDRWSLLFVTNKGRFEAAMFCHANGKRSPYVDFVTVWLPDKDDPESEHGVDVDAICFVKYY